MNLLVHVTNQQLHIRGHGLDLTGELVARTNEALACQQIGLGLLNG